MSGQLERLLAQATPGPWYAVVNDLIGGSLVATEDRPASQLDPRHGGLEVADMAGSTDARLIALAPTLARLLVDAMAWVEEITEKPYRVEELWNAGNRLLARFAEVEQQAGEGQG